MRRRDRRRLPFLRGWSRGLRAARARLCGGTCAARSWARARGPQATARGSDASQGGTPSQVPCARAAQPRHRARRHAIRLDARVLRAQQHLDTARPGLGRGALPRDRHDPAQRHRGQGNKTAGVQPGAGRPGGAVRGPGCGRRRPAARALWPELDPAAAAPVRVRGHRAAPPPCADRDGALRRADRRGTCSDAEPRDLARACSVSSRRRMPRPGRASTSIRQSSCRSAVRQARAAGASGAPRPASHRRPRTCWRSSRSSTSCPASSWSTAALSKLKSTYTDKLPAQLNPRTGRVHTCYHQAVAATGRLSSADPNLQNIPIRTAEGRRMRQAFVAPPGYVIVAADYSQIELRIMAHLSGDEGLLSAFADERDIHQATAAEVFGLETAAVGADQRRAAKAINFGLSTACRRSGSRASSASSAAQRSGTLTSISSAIPGVRQYMERHARGSARAGIRRNGVRAASVSAGHQCPQRAAPAVRRARGDQRADAGHAPPTSSSAR